MSDHGQGELCQRLEACNICLRVLAELWPEMLDLCHGPGFGEPEKLRRCADPTPYANSVSFCHGISCRHAVQKWCLTERAKLVVTEACRKPEQCLSAFIAEVNLASRRVCKANPLRLVRGWRSRDVLLALHVDGADL